MSLLEGIMGAGAIGSAKAGMDALYLPKYRQRQLALAMASRMVTEVSSKPKKVKHKLKDAKKSKLKLLAINFLEFNS